MSDDTSPNDGYFRNFSKLLLKYRDEGFLCDTVLSTGANSLRAHGIILATASPFLKGVFETKVDSNLRYVYLPEVDFETLTIAVYFMYTGCLVLDPRYMNNLEEFDILTTSLGKLGFSKKKLSNCQILYESKKLLTSDSFSLDVSSLVIAPAVDSEADDEFVPKSSVVVSNDIKQELDESCLRNLQKIELEDVKSRKRKAVNEPIKPRSGNYSDTDKYECKSDVSSAAEKRSRGRRPGQRSVVKTNQKCNGATDSGTRLTRSKAAVKSNAQLQTSRTQLISSQRICKRSKSDSTPQSKRLRSRISKRTKNCSAAISREPVDCGDDEDTDDYDGPGGSPLPGNTEGANCADDNIVNHWQKKTGGKCTSVEYSDATVVVDSKNGPDSGSDDKVNSVELIGSTIGGDFTRIDDSELLENLVISSVNDDPARDVGKKFRKIASSRAMVAKRPYVCGRCNRRFVSLFQVIQHVETHEKPVVKKRARKFPCDVCNKFFDSRARVRLHMLIHTGERPHACTHCDMKFNSADNLRRHELRHEAIKPYLCELCGSSFIQKQSLIDHVEHQHTEWICPLCSCKFTKRSLLMKHGAAEHGNEIDFAHVKRVTRDGGGSSECVETLLSVYLCETCGKSFTNPHSLRQHSVRHRKLLACEICSKEFACELALKRHSVRHTGEKLAVESRKNWCELCEKEFSCGVALRTHKLQHSEKRPFACPDCKKTYVSEERLKAHRIYYHSSERLAKKTGVGLEQQFHCTVCDKMFTSALGLQIHGVVHSGQRPFACKHCDKRFSFESNLNTHMRIHTGEKPYSCTLCGKKYRQSNHLKNHIDSHNGVKPYPCKLCSKAYKNSLDLRYHYTRFHHLDIKVEKTNIRSTYTVEIPQASDGCTSVSDIRQDLLAPCLEAPIQ